MLNLDLYLAAFGINDYFYDIVFDLEINSNYHNLKKKFLLSVYLLFNLLFLICCLFPLIFIVIPIIRNKKKEQDKKGRYTKFKEKIEMNEEQFDINERFTFEPTS